MRNLCIVYSIQTHKSIWILTYKTTVFVSWSRPYPPLNICRSIILPLVGATSAPDLSPPWTWHRMSIGIWDGGNSPRRCFVACVHQTDVPILQVSSAHFDRVFVPGFNGRERHVAFHLLHALHSLAICPWGMTKIAASAEVLNCRLLSEGIGGKRPIEKQDMVRCRDDFSAQTSFQGTSLRQRHIGTLQYLQD